MIWTFAITSIALFMVTLDNLVVTTALPVIRHDLHASLARPRVDRQRLHPHLRGAAADRRRARRPVRPAPRCSSLGIGIFTARARPLAALAPSIEALNIARAVQGVGGAIVMPLTLTHAQRRRAGRAARHRARRLGRHRRPRRRARAARRRRRRPGHLLALDLLAQRADRPRPDPARVAAPRREHGPERKLDLPGLGLASAGLFGIVWGLIRGNEQGWASPEIVGSLGAGAALLGGVRRLGAPGRAADAADALLPQPRRSRSPTCVAVHVLRDVRLDLPARPVLPDRAGLLAVRVGPAHPARGRRADVRRADRGRAVRPDRRPAHHGRRALRCRRSALAWIARGLDARPRRTRSSSRRSSLAGVGMGLFFAPVANIVLSAVRPAGGGQGVRRQQRDPRARRRLRRRGAGLGLRRLRRLRHGTGVRRRADRAV